MKMFLALLALCLGMSHVYGSAQAPKPTTIELPDDLDIDEEEEIDGDE